MHQNSLKKSPNAEVALGVAKRKAGTLKEV